MAVGGTVEAPLTGVLRTRLSRDPVNLTKVTRPLQRHRGRSVAQSNPTRSKQNPIRSSLGDEAINPLHPLVPKNVSPVPSLEGTSVRVSQPRPSNAGAIPSGKEGEHNFRWLEDTLTPVKSVVQLQKAIREELISNCISKP